MKYTTYLTIETDDGKYKLSALFYSKKNHYCMPSLEINGKNYCDNPLYFINTLLPFLKRNYSQIERKTDNKRLKKLIPNNRRKEVLGIIKQGKKLGFFKE